MSHVPKITIETFTAILHSKLDDGICTFTGKRTGNIYRISYNEKRRRWYMEVNGSRRFSRVKLASIANTIWNLELSDIGGDNYGKQPEHYSWSPQ